MWWSASVRGKAEECWKECVDIVKWQWENNEGLLIGGWEPHRDVASHCFQGPRGGRRCQSVWRSALEPHKTWTELRLVDSGPFACIEIQRRLVASFSVLISVLMPRSLSRLPSGKYYPAKLFIIYVAQDKELTATILMIIRLYILMLSKQLLAWEMVIIGHLSFSWGEWVIYPLRHMTNGGGEIFIWDQHAGKWTE